MADTPPPRRIEIFRTGTHAPVRGAPVVADAAMLSEIAATYDPATHEAPLVIGHPALDAPAYGWVKGLEVDGDRLVAVVDQMEPRFAAAVRAGRYKARSVSLFRPDHPRNPHPGRWSVKHVGFLGAAQPAVSGLAPVHFAADDEDTVVEFGTGAANRVLPDREIGWIDDAARREHDDAEPAQAPGFTADTRDNEEAVMAAETKKDGGTPADLAAREKALADREAAFAAAEAERTRAADAAFLDRLIEAGRFRPAHRTAVLEFMARLDTEAAAEFAAEGAEPRSPRDWFKGFLETQPPVVEFRTIVGPERPAPGGGADFAVPPGHAIDHAALDLDARARAYQRANPGTPYIDAVKAVQR